MVPIGIVTRNRVGYLDVTLRSLTASTLPSDVPVVVFDDGSDDLTTQLYLTTNEQVSSAKSWPSHQTWRATLGLGIINDRNTPPVGVKGLLQVDQLGKSPKGVVEGSCEAIRRLFAAYPHAPGVILLQDDVLFKEDWYSRLTTVALEHTFSRPLGVLAGLKLNHRYKDIGNPLPPVYPSGITAQCLYISRACLKLDMLKRPQKSKVKFDDTLRRGAAKAGLWAGVILPFVCQHFGIKSLVRPARGWSRGKNGRIGYYVQPPYVLAEGVRSFYG